MKIKRVIYELFESDFTCLQGMENSEEHFIDREICLVLNDDRQFYISWTDQPEQYCIGYQEKRWFKNNAEKLIDVSNWKIWIPVIHQNCELISHNSDHQVLELKSKKASVYFSSREGEDWHSDTISISSFKPAYNF